MTFDMFIGLHREDSMELPKHKKMHEPGGMVPKMYLVPEITMRETYVSWAP